jgi:hypothetical protein
LASGDLLALSFITGLLYRLDRFHHR